jgi:hypothetical protein
MEDSWASCRRTPITLGFSFLVWIKVPNEKIKVVSPIIGSEKFQKIPAGTEKIRVRKNRKYKVFKFIFFTSKKILEKKEIIFLKIFLAKKTCDICARIGDLN